MTGGMGCAIFGKDDFDSFEPPPDKQVVQRRANFLIWGLSRVTIAVQAVRIDDPALRSAQKPIRPPLIIAVELPALV